MIKRLIPLRKSMAEKGISNLFVTSMSDIYYLTGFTGSTAFLFVSADNAVFVTDGRYTEQSKVQIGSDFEIKIVDDYRKMLAEYAEKKHLMYT